MSPSAESHVNSFVVDSVTIFTGDDFIEHGHVVIQDGKIAQVGSGPYSDSLQEKLPMISKPGHTLIPGLIDSHIHALEANIESLEQSLRFGVTTVCDMHNDPRSIAIMKEHANNPARKNIYADFKCAGLGASVEGGWPAPILEEEFKHEPEKEQAAAITKALPRLKSPADGEAFVKTQISQNGASYIKMMHELGDCIDMKLPRPPIDVQRAVVDAAHKHGIIAVGHAFSYAGAKDLLTSGADGLTHIFFDKPECDDWLQLMRKNNAHCTPTLSLCASQTGEGEQIQIPFTQQPLSQRMLFDKRPRLNVGLGANNAKGSFENAIENTKAVYRSGLPIVIGSDAAGKRLGTAYGLGVHSEMYLLSHKVGMSPTEILKSATSLTACRFGFSDRGRLQAGKKADLVLLDGDIRQTLADKNSLCLPIREVWRDGVKAKVFSEDI